MDLTNLFNLQTPQGSMMAGLANSLGRAAMPSRMPISLGAALGAGAGGMMQGYQQGIQNQTAQMKNQLTANTLAYIKKMQGMNGTVGAPAAPQGTPSGLLGAPASPTGLLDYNQAGNAAQTNPGAFTPAPAPASPTSYFNPRQLFQRGMMFNLMGLPGGSGMISAALANDPTLARQVSLAKKGMNVGPNGQVSYAPGYIQSQGNLAGAQAAAKFPYEVTSNFLRYAGHNVSAPPTSNVYSGFSLLPPDMQALMNRTMSGVGGGGQSSTTPVSPTQQIQARPIPAAGPGAIGSVQPFIQATQPQSAPVTAGVAIPPPAVPTGVQPVIHGITPFQNSAQKAHAADLEKESTNLRSAADNAVSTNYNLDQMSSALQGFKPGPGTNLQMWLEHNASILGKPFGVEPPKNLGSYQEFQKYANQVAFAATRQMGSREAAQIVDLQIKSNPNAELNPESVTGLINSMHSMNDYIIAKSKAEQNWRASHDGTTAGFDQSWQSEFDPRVWEIPNMSPIDKQRFVHSLSPTQAKQFQAQYENAKRAGYIQ